MIVFDGASADQVWRHAATELRAAAPVQEGRDQPTRELLHAAFSIHQPRQRVVFGRVINPAFALAEVLWILAGANSVDFLRFWNPRMKRFSDDGTRFHGAYGYRLGRQPRLAAHIRDALIPAPEDRRERPDQLFLAYEALRNTPNSRQVVLQIWDNTQDLPNPEPRSKDIPCNLMSHLLLRDGKLEWLQVMRSNDLIWGTPYNFIQWTSMQEIVAGWLGAEVGTYTHISDSLHVYQRHWPDLDQIASESPTLPLNTASLGLPYDDWEQVWNTLLDVAIALTRAGSAQEIRAAAQLLADVPPGYQQWGAVLTAEALRRRGLHDEARQHIDAAGAYWRASWLQWYAQQTPPQSQAGED
jgi:thymidylate synthase